MICNQTEKQERAYLQQILNALKDTINKINASIRQQEQDLRDHKDYLWQNIKEIDKQEVRSMRESILNTLAVGEGIISLRNRLAKLLDIPYFGRIDFQEKTNGSRVQPIYIGIHTFHDSQNNNNLIYDWRAPMSGMFYEYELGEATYISPSGEVSGTISVKRQ